MSLAGGELSALPALAVVGSANVDITAMTEHLPRAGETVGPGRLRRDPGGKGANQAVAAARLGARTRMIGAVGDDEDGTWMLATLQAAGVDVAHVRRAADHTGTALITVDAEGENQIVVCPGANRLVTTDGVEFGTDEVVLAQVEIPVEVVAGLADVVPGFLAVNAAPVSSMPRSFVERVDLVVVNAVEYAAQPWLRDVRMVAVTYGGDGALLLSGGREVASAPALHVPVVSTVGAGDAFGTALTLALAAGVD
ncbi:PfkB family carbohydrate kinase, partial [Miniimonas arenae]|uniref:PfkB family carbohydrate kinase n=1 Tax=Miniimonas arenae TaxID=676201 RepID=UPI0028AE17CB